MMLKILLGFFYLLVLVVFAFVMIKFISRRMKVRLSRVNQRSAMLSKSTLK